MKSPSPNSQLPSANPLPVGGAAARAERPETSGEPPPGVCRGGDTHFISLLGFDPVKVVQKAIADGVIPARVRAVRRGGRGIKYVTEAERLAARRATLLRWRDRNASAGLRRNGQPKKPRAKSKPKLRTLVNTKRPELRGLSKREYHRRYVALWRKEAA